MVLSEQRILLFESFLMDIWNFFCEPLPRSSKMEKAGQTKELTPMEVPAHHA